MSYDQFLISAKPQIKNVHPLKIYTMSSELSSSFEYGVVLKGGTFYAPLYVFLSANDVNMFDGTQVYLLSAKTIHPNRFYNITAVLIHEFNYTENFLFFNLPQIPKTTGFFDIIVQNEADYGNILTSVNLELSNGVRVMDIY